MDIIYKRLTENELAIFIAMRINQLREEGATVDIDLEPALKDYYKRHIRYKEYLFVKGVRNCGIKIREKF